MGKPFLLVKTGYHIDISCKRTPFNSLDVRCFYLRNTIISTLELPNKPNYKGNRVMNIKLTKLQLITLLKGELLEKRNPDPTSETFGSDQLHDWVIEGISLGIENGLKPPEILLQRWRKLCIKIDKVG